MPAWQHGQFLPPAAPPGAPATAGAADADWHSQACHSPWQARAGTARPATPHGPRPCRYAVRGCDARGQHGSPAEPQARGTSTGGVYTRDNTRRPARRCTAPRCAHLAGSAPPPHPNPHPHPPHLLRSCDPNCSSRTVTVAEAEDRVRLAAARGELLCWHHRLPAVTAAASALAQRAYCCASTEP